MKKLMTYKNGMLFTVRQNGEGYQYYSPMDIKYGYIDKSKVLILDEKKEKLIKALISYQKAEWIEKSINTIGKEEIHLLDIKTAN